VPQFFDEQASGSQYGTGSVASTCSTRDYKDATDLVVQPVCATGYRTHAPTVSDGAAEDGTGRGTPIVPAIAVAMINMQGSKGNAVAQADGPSYTLNAMHGHDVHAVAFAVHGEHSSAMTSSNPNTQVARPVETARCLDTTGGYATSQGGTLVGQEVTGTLGARASSGGGFSTDFEVAGGLQPTPTMAVRRLLPVECERLQGFPDDWTLIPWRGKPTPDGPRYKAMGNSMAVPVMRWIGERLDRVAKGDL